MAPLHGYFGIYSLHIRRLTSFLPPFFPLSSPFLLPFSYFLFLFSSFLFFPRGVPTENRAPRRGSRSNQWQRPQLANADTQIFTRAPSVVGVAGVPRICGGVVDGNSPDHERSALAGVLHACMLLPWNSRRRAYGCAIGSPGQNIAVHGALCSVAMLLPPRPAFPRQKVGGSGGVLPRSDN